MKSTPYAAGIVAALIVVRGAAFEAQPLPVLNGLHTIAQGSSGRLLDAHVTPETDFSVVTRPPQHNASQRWLFTHMGAGVYTIEQQSTGRRLDAHDTADKDFAVVTRPHQNNTTQRWIVRALGSDRFEIRQQATGRNMDAHDTPDKDFAVVTRPLQNNSTQQWVIRPATSPPPPANPGTCTLFGSVMGPVDFSFCVDPKCTQKDNARLSHISLRTTSPGQQIAVRQLAGRDYVLTNVAPGPTYVVAAPGGFASDPIGGPVRCEANRSHRLDIRILRFASES